MSDGKSNRSLQCLILLFGLMSISSVAEAAQKTLVASYYWQPQAVASGGRFNPHGLTAAHRSLPFGTRLRVCLHGCVIVKINDRGPYHPRRQLDLSLSAAKAISLTKYGVRAVKVEILR